MTRLTACLAAAVLALALGSTLASAAVPTSYYHKRADCAREAKAMHFGVHFIKRARFIRTCMTRQ
jgi:hypothetical protein